MLKKYSHKELHIFGRHTIAQFRTFY